MMGWQAGNQRQLFYLFNLERRIPASHLLRRINPIVYSLVGYVGPFPEPPAMGLSLEGECMAPATADHELPCARCSIAV